jgi:WD40 repeat protein
LSPAEDDSVGPSTRGWAVAGFIARYGASFFDELVEGTATASGDHTARLWDATTGQEIIALRGHEHGVLSASFSPDGMDHV